VCIPRIDEHPKRYARNDNKNYWYDEFHPGSEKRHCSQVEACTCRELANCTMFIVYSISFVLVAMPFSTTGFIGQLPAVPVQELARLAATQLARTKVAKGQSWP